MRVLLQRVKEASVRVDQQIVGAIEQGCLLLVGLTHEDSEQEIEWMAQKIAHLRIFADEEGKMNRSLLDIEGAVLSVSQFTLYGDCRKGRRPNFMQAARPEQAEQLYEQFNQCLRDYGLPVETGVFGAMMDVSLINDGPVTLWLETPE